MKKLAKILQKRHTVCWNMYTKMLHSGEKPHCNRYMYTKITWQVTLSPIQIEQILDKYDWCKWFKTQN